MQAETAGAHETERLGAELARELSAGDVVVVSGEIGAGKTTLVRGALRAMGVSGPVTSPTFALARRYDDLPVPASHLDLHRLAALEGEDPALLEDYVDAEHVAFVEWPAVAERALAGLVVARVTLEHAGGDRRRVTVERCPRA